MLKYLPVILEGPLGKAHVYAKLVDGATLTLLEAGVAAQIGLSGLKTSLTVRSTGEMTTSDPKSQHVHCRISGANNHEEFDLWDIQTMNGLDLPRQTIGEVGLKS